MYRAKGFPNRNDPIDINRMKFVPDQQENELDGVVHLITDKDKVEQLQVLIGTYARGCNYLFAAMWPVSLCTDNIDKITNEPYAIAVKPAGQRYLLYVDPNGRMYFENTNQNFFQVIQGIPTSNTLLDGILTRRKPKRSTETLGQLTFVIQDAIRCNGRDLRSLTILERIAVVKVIILTTFLKLWVLYKIFFKARNNGTDGGFRGAKSKRGNQRKRSFTI